METIKRVPRLDQPTAEQVETARQFTNEVLYYALDNGETYDVAIRRVLGHWQRRGGGPKAENP